MPTNEERTNQELQDQLDALREEMRQLRSQLAGPAAPATPSHVLSRRSLLRMAPIAAVGGAVTALAASSPAAAATGDPLLLGRTNHADATTELDSALTLDGRLTANGGIEADSPVTIQSLGGGTSLEVRGSYIDESPSTGPAIIASAAGWIAVTATATDTPTRFSELTSYGTAVKAQSEGGTAVAVSSTSSTTPNDAVTIDYQGTSRAFYAQSHNSANYNGTVTGVNEGKGVGVWGELRGDTRPGIGVVGVAGAMGRGAQFGGGAAQLRLVPSTASTHPSTGKVGDLFLDKSVRLWLCTKASTTTTAASWKQVA